MSEYSEIERLRVDLQLAEARANMAIHMVTALVHSLRQAGVTSETAYSLAYDEHDPGALLEERPEYFYAILGVETEHDPRDFLPPDIERERRDDKMIEKIRTILLERNRRSGVGGQKIH